MPSQLDLDHARQLLVDLYGPITRISRWGVPSRHAEMLRELVGHHGRALDEITHLAARVAELEQAAAHLYDWWVRPDPATIRPGMTAEETNLVLDELHTLGSYIVVLGDLIGRDPLAPTATATVTPTVEGGGRRG